MTHPASVWEKLGDLIKDLISKAVINSLNVNDLGTSYAEPPYQYFIGLPCRIKLFNHKEEVGILLAKSAFVNLQSAARHNRSACAPRLREALVLHRFNSRLDFAVTSTSIFHCTKLFFCYLQCIFISLLSAFQSALLNHIL